jgi:hypothetical protein
LAVIGSLAVNIVAATDKFISGIHNAQGVLAGFVKKTSLAGAAVTAAFAGMLKKFESAGSQLFDLSKSTGLSVEKLSFLKFAAEQSGTSLSVMTKAARQLQKDGIDPNKFEQIARSIAGITDPTKRAQAAFEAFGIRSGQALLPMLKDIPELQKRFQSLGGEFTTKMATAADSLGDSMGELRLVLSNIGHTIAAEVAPAVTGLTKFITDNSAAVRTWISDHGTLIRNVAILAATLGTVVPALYAINTAISVVTKSIVGLRIAALAASSHPLIAALAVLAAGGVAAHSYFKQATPSPNASSKQAQEQTAILRQIASQPSTQLKVAGVR